MIEFESRGRTRGSGWTGGPARPGEAVVHSPFRFNTPNLLGVPRSRRFRAASNLCTCLTFPSAG